VEAKAERAMAELLEECDFTVCTQDSLSMLAEVQAQIASAIEQLLD
jgi:hypothetical protein